MWWAAALNLVPVQAAFFVAVGCGVRHLRGEGRLWLAATMAAVAGGLLFDVKGVLVLPVLAAVAVAYFAQGGLWARLRSLVVEQRAAVVTIALALVGYSAYYLAAVPQIATNTDPSTVPDVMDAMLGTAFPAGILGGPWRWSLIAPPTAYADPPGVLVHLAWVVLALVVLHSALRRRRALRAWALLAGYLLLLLVLLVVSRGPTFGALIGLEYRYLTDAVGVATLCLGLAYLPMLGAVESSAPREPPLLAVKVPALGRGHPPAGRGGLGGRELVGVRADTGTTTTRATPTCIICVTTCGPKGGPTWQRLSCRTPCSPTSPRPATPLAGWPHSCLTGCGFPQSAPACSLSDPTEGSARRRSSWAWPPSLDPPRAAGGGSRRPVPGSRCRAGRSGGCGGCASATLPRTTHR